MQTQFFDGVVVAWRLGDDRALRLMVERVPGEPAIAGRLTPGQTDKRKTLFREVATRLRDESGVTTAAEASARWHRVRIPARVGVRHGEKYVWINWLSWR